MTMAHECEELTWWIFWGGRAGVGWGGGNRGLYGNERGTAHKQFFTQVYRQ